DGDPAREHAEAAAPDDQRNRQGRKQLYGGVIKRISKNRVFERDHVLPVYIFKVFVGSLLAVEELDDRHARDVLLGEAVDAGDGGADAAVAFAHAIAEEARDDEDQ